MDMKKSLLVAALMGASIAGVSIGISCCRPDPKEVAQCLADKGAVMYGAHWCSYCKKQIEEFGEEGWKIMSRSYVECGVPEKIGRLSQECYSLGIRAVPTWDFGYGLESGFKSLDELEDICDEL